MINWVFDVGLRGMEHPLATSMINSEKQPNISWIYIGPICMSKLSKYWLHLYWTNNQFRRLHQNLQRG